MVNRVHKAKDGKYHIKGDVYQMLVGSRAQVWHGTAYKTAGGLTKKQLKQNKHGKIVSKAKSAKGPQMLKRLHRKGYFTKKGKFGWVKKTPVRRSSKYVAKRSAKKSKRRKSRKKTVKRKRRRKR
tara:strand:+ start:413 stop:787 length:375 start_codon:yes stop_codon:yes gene_type:complete